MQASTPTIAANMASAVVQQKDPGGRRRDGVRTNEYTLNRACDDLKDGNDRRADALEDACQLG